MAMGADERATYDVPRVAKLLGISRTTAYQLAAAGELPGVFRLGRRLLVSRVALERVLSEAGPRPEPGATS